MRFVGTKGRTPAAEACCVVAGSICQLCLAKRPDSVQWAAACSAGGCHQTVPALPKRHSSWKAHPIQDQCEDLALMIWMAKATAWVAWSSLALQMA